MVTGSAKIMIVAEDPKLAAKLAGGITAMGQASSWILSSVSEALTHPEKAPWDLAILDLRLEGAIDAALSLRDLRETPTVFVDDDDDDDDDDDATLARSRLATPAGYLRRCCTARELRQTVEVALHVARVEREHRICGARRRRAEERLETQHDYLRTLLENIPDYIYFKDRDRRFVLASTSFCALFKLSMEEILGKRDEDLFPPEVAASTVADDLRVIEEELPIINREEGSEEIAGSPVWVLSTKLPWRDQRGEVVGLFGISRLITDRKKADEERLELERRLIHAQKLESLGVLAGGIAHDFSNLLHGVLGHVDLARIGLSPSAPQNLHLHRIAQIATHAADLCRQMLAYSGRGRFTTEPVDISALVEEMSQLLRTSISKKAELRLELRAGLPTVEVDPTQIRQVFMNLLTNASESLAEESGTITITTGLVDPGGQRLGPDASYREGCMVFFEVADTGCGMDEATQAKLFDPFFTTKFTGRGLGMSAVQGIVRGHQGRIDITSAPGHGSSLIVLLPASNAALPAPVDDIQAGELLNGLTALLVDDELTTLEVGCFMLEALGFQVHRASDGVEALELLRRTTVDLVLIDLMMPRMNGVETFREMRRLGIDTPVILSSAFAEEEAGDYVRRDGFDDFIQKPYRMKELDDRVRRVVGRYPPQPRP